MKRYKSPPNYGRWAVRRGMGGGRVAPRRGAWAFSNLTTSTGGRNSTTMAYDARAGLPGCGLRRDLFGAGARPPALTNTIGAAPCRTCQGSSNANVGQPTPRGTWPLRGACR